MSKVARFLLCGDVMLGRLVDQIFPKHVIDEESEHHVKHLLSIFPSFFQKSRPIDHKYVWGDVLPLFKEADLRIINLETSVTTSNNPYPKTFNYRMHPENVKALKEASIEYCSLANNHTLDYMEEGLFDTMKHLDAAGIQWAGVGKHIDEAMRPAILTSAKGHKTMCLSFSDHPPQWAAGGQRPGINFLDIENYNPYHISKIKSIIEQTKKKENIDLVLVSLHWGSNYCWVPPKPFQHFAHDLIDKCGVDIIHGHSSHHIQGIEIYNNKPILYGCGDFIDDYAIDEHYRNDLGFMYFVEMNMEEKSLNKIELVPTKIEHFSVTSKLPHHDRHWLHSTMSKLCQSLGTHVQTSDGDQLIIHHKPYAQAE